MKRSEVVPALYVSAVAATVGSGCSSPTQVRYCTDQFGKILPDVNCERRPVGGYVGGYVPRFFYGGTARSGFLQGGSAVAPDNARIVSPSGGLVRSPITRGGFGGSGRSFGGFGG